MITMGKLFDMSSGRVPKNPNEDQASCKIVVDHIKLMIGSSSPEGRSSLKIPLMLHELSSVFTDGETHGLEIR